MEFPQGRNVQVGQTKTRYWAGGDHGSTVLLHVFAKSGHLPMVEHAQALNALLLGFLSG